MAGDLRNLKIIAKGKAGKALGLDKSDLAEAQRANLIGDGPDLNYKEFARLQRNAERVRRMKFDK